MFPACRGFLPYSRRLFGRLTPHECTVGDAAAAVAAVAVPVPRIDVPDLSIARRAVNRLKDVYTTNRSISAGTAEYRLNPRDGRLFSVFVPRKGIGCLA